MAERIAACATKRIKPEESMHSTPRGTVSPLVELTENEQAICTLIVDNGSLNSAEAATALNTTQRNGLVVIHGLMDRGIIEGYGGSKNRRYRFTRPPARRPA